MRLVRFEAFGFKSFADRTVLDFRGGITGFVGPNGCGKSNVVDAIRWALGEQSAKSLRGEEMQDVVFRGSRDRKPSGYAEVTLLFDNQDATLPIPHSEVALTRRLYRTGESEYLLNRQPCRLRDIKGLFLDTGIGVSAYSVIEQGRVGALVQGTAQDRRAILDEAAGISRFRAHVHQSMLKLERVEQNLLRVTDIRDEVDGRLKSIRRQASRARRYRELELEVRSARASLGHSRLRRLEAEADALRARRAELEDRCACAQAAQARTVADLAGIETRRALAEEARRTASEDLARAQEQARSCALRQEDATRRLADLGREREAVVLGRADVEGRIRAQEERLAALESEAARLDDDRRQAEEQVAGADARAAALQSGIRDAQQALERARTALMDAVRNESDAANERRGIEAELRAREEEAARLAEALSR
ncbi:MAG: AAA family ATPase, partial [Planctomycetes bacterium]|nr:AAA family ATPase [Planctomycetota bacterium]